jgi:hypothetical protein
MDYKTTTPHTKAQVIKYLYKLIGNTADGFFHDETWEPIHKIFQTFRDANVAYGITDSRYIQNVDGVLIAKVWKLEITFIDKKGTDQTLYGTITAAGAGSVEYPLERYDVTVVLG